MKTAPETMNPQLAILKKHFANCFDKNGNFNPHKLQEIVQASGVSLSKEGYNLNWLGKSYARLLANENIHTLLKADKAHNAKPANITSKNLLIKGDNLEVLKHLMGAYSEKVKTIYIDPPYNTGSDGFVYQDDRKFTIKQLSSLAGIDEDEAKRILEFTSSNSNSHSAWLTFMYPRLYLAKQLLKDEGVIFISIDDNEQAQLKSLCDEVFGEENFVECICWNKRIPKNDKGIGNIHESILLYVKNSSKNTIFNMRKDGLDDVYQLIEKLENNKTSLPEAEAEIKKLYKKNAYDRGITLYRSLTEDYRLWGKINMSWPNADTFGPRYEVLHPITQKPVKVPERGWRWIQETFNLEAMILDGQYQDIKHQHDGSVVCGRIWFSSDENTQPSSITYLDDVNNLLLRSILSMKSDGGVELENLFDGKSYFSYPKPTSLIKTLVGSTSMAEGDICLDFFAGSGTTAHAVMALNVEDDLAIKFICVQLPEPTDKAKAAYKAGYKTIFDITQSRITKAAAKIKSQHPDYKGDLGFKIYETLPMFDKYLESYEELTEDLELFSVNTLTQDDRHNLMLTWSLRDGIPLGTPLEPVKLGDYIAYATGETLYLVEPDISLDAVIVLLEQLDNNPNFSPNRLVVLGYLLDSKTQRELTEAVKHYNNRKGIELTLDIRFN